MSSLGTVASSLLGGWISDRIGRRKNLVILSAAVIMVGLIIIVTSNDFSQVLLGQTIVGVGIGCSTAVDVALIADLLPADQTENAKTFGVFNIAQALPQSLVPPWPRRSSPSPGTRACSLEERWSDSSAPPS